MQDFKQLQVWQKAHLLTLAVYKATQSFPSDERFGLLSQMRRSASSVPTNIAEGCGRGSNADFARFLQIGMGSANELEYQLILSKDLGHLEAKSYETLYASVTEVQRMLASLIKRVRFAS